ncbi:hypothetical protein D4764_03G0005540 [Takifugu flavidus]|uniref:Uncharacterized protein n=1 Tax=Takifugu flavidus TaxID=433684 RepID=A0A5C6N8C0_9TELE|nr:hypothetical protein D4764_03G0005540 [Takifugu flavidus]
MFCLPASGAREEERKWREMGCEERPSVFPPASRFAPSDGLQLPGVSHRAADVRSRRSSAESRGRFLRSRPKRSAWKRQRRFQVGSERRHPFRGLLALPTLRERVFAGTFLTLSRSFYPPSLELAEIPDLCVCLGSVLNCIESMCATPIMRDDLCAASQLLLFLTTKRDIPEDP